MVSMCLIVGRFNLMSACYILILQRTFEDGGKPKGVIHHLLQAERNARRNDGLKLFTRKNVEGGTLDMLQAGNSSILLMLTF